MNLSKLKQALYNSYSKETAYSLVRDDWTPDNNTVGQCAVTALIVNDYYGGNIKKCVVHDISHYYNEINGGILDLTSEQFETKLNYDNSENKTRAQILNNIDTKKRYEILKKRVREYLLNQIDKEVKFCKSCVNYVEKFEHNTAIHLGKSNDIVIIGEAPAKNGWRISGKAWHGVEGNLTATAKIMQKLLANVNLNLMDITFIEAVKCYPLERKDLNKCSINCHNYTLGQLEILKPKLVLILGDTATKMILPIKYKKFSDVVGNKYKIDEMIAIPIYHPSPISPVGYKNNVPIFFKLKEEGLLKNIV